MCRVQLGGVVVVVVVVVEAGAHWGEAGCRLTGTSLGHGSDLVLGTSKARRVGRGSRAGARRPTRAGARALRAGARTRPSRLAPAAAGRLRLRPPRLAPSRSRPSSHVQLYVIHRYPTHPQPHPPATHCLARAAPVDVRPSPRRPASNLEARPRRPPASHRLPPRLAAQLLRRRSFRNLYEACQAASAGRAHGTGRAGHARAPDAAVHSEARALGGRSCATQASSGAADNRLGLT